MRVAVTGAGGFLGRAVVSRLLESDHEPVAVVRSGKDATEYEKMGVGVILRDLSQDEAYDGFLRECQGLIHCAALRKHAGRWEQFRKTNIEITRRLMECALDTKLERIVYISTASVYGDDRGHYGTNEEADYGRRTVDYYIRSKTEADRIVSRLIKDKGLPAVILRPGHIWGPGERTIIPFMVERLSSRNLFLVDGGENLLSLTFIDNVVEAIFLALESEDATGRVFNITDGSRVTSRQFAGDIMRILGIEVQLRSVPYPLVYSISYLIETFYRIIRKSSSPPYTRFLARFLKYSAFFDISRAIYDLDYSPKISYESGMTIMTPYLRSLYYGGK
jgi:nucleoside-diphosphate-sugar epimerase